MSKYHHRGGAEVGIGYVEGVKHNYPPQYSIPKYLQFIERSLDRGFKVWLYMPRNSVSKYVTVYCQKKSFKVRFSNHMPIKYLEAKQTCDFFVGVTNFGVSNTEQAWAAMLEHFQIGEANHDHTPIEHRDG